MAYSYNLVLCSTGGILAAALQGDGRYTAHPIAPVRNTDRHRLSAALAAFPISEHGACIGIYAAVHSHDLATSISDPELLKRNPHLKVAKDLSAFWHVPIWRFACGSLPRPVLPLGSDPRIEASIVMGACVARLETAHEMHRDKMAPDERLARAFPVPIFSEGENRLLSPYEPADLPFLLAGNADVQRNRLVEAMQGAALLAAPEEV